jgi:protein-tyrosine-phosphatase
MRPLLLVLFAGSCANPAVMQLPRPAVKSTVLFLCPYGGAKSVIAASYFNRRMEELALPFVGIAAAAEEPYEAVPAPVADHLLGDGFDVRTFKPRRVEPEDVHRATRVVSIDCNLEGVNVAGIPVERWDDVPKVSVDLEASVAAVRRHVDALASDLGRPMSGRR